MVNCYNNTRLLVGCPTTGRTPDTTPEGIRPGTTTIGAFADVNAVKVQFDPDRLTATVLAADLPVTAEAQSATGEPTTYTVRYVKNVYRPGAGHLVPLRGGAKLEVMLGVREFDDAGHWAYQPEESDIPNVAGYRTLRQIEYAGSSEDTAWIGIGVRARLPFRVFTVDGPGSGSRVVVDIAHRW
jgi:hypothetical protein